MLEMRGMISTSKHSEAWEEVSASTLEVFLSSGMMWENASKIISPACSKGSFINFSSGGIFRYVQNNSMKNFSFSIGILSCICMGCGLLRIDGGVRVHPDDWITYGGNPQHTNTAVHELHLPLVQLWEYDAGAGFGNTPVVVTDSLIFVGTLQGELHVIHLRTGKRVGAVDLGSAIVGTPIVRGELVYVALTHDEESLVAFNLQHGAPEWRA